MHLLEDSTFGEKDAPSFDIHRTKLWQVTTVRRPKMCLKKCASHCALTSGNSQSLWTVIALGILIFKVHHKGACIKLTWTAGACKRHYCSLQIYSSEEMEKL